MTHRQKLRLDRMLARPLAFCCNGWARLRGGHGHGHENAGEPRCVVVAKWVGMGSILQTVPLLRALRRRHPDCWIVFATALANQELARRLPGVDGVVTLEERSLGGLCRGLPGTLLRLRRLRPDIYIDLELYSAFSSLLAWVVGGRQRAGFYRDSTRFKSGLYTHLAPFSTRAPVRQLYLELGGFAGGEEGGGGPQVLVEAADRAALRACFEPAGPYLVINPNASELLLERRWPAASYASAIERIARSSSGCAMALVGTADEAGYVGALVGQLSPEARARVVNLAGRLSLGAFLALLESADCVLTNDSGPMHMAVAVSAPAVCLFGPGNPEHYGHHGPLVENLYRPVPCSPCVYESDHPPCGGDNICMQRLPVEAVVAAVERRLRASMERRLSAGAPIPEYTPAAALAAGGSD